MTDERPPTCKNCGAPGPFCKCDNPSFGPRDTPDYGTAPQQNAVDEGAPTDLERAAAESLAKTLADANAAAEAHAAIENGSPVLVPAHAAHLDPNSIVADEEGGGSTGFCAVCNRQVYLRAHTEPEGWPYSAKDWALQPEAPWLHITHEGEATPMGSLQPSPLTKFLMSGAGGKGHSEFKEQVKRMFLDSAPTVPAAAPYPETKDWESLLRPEPEGVSELVRGTQDDVYEIELARFVRDAPDAPPSIELKTVTVAEDSLEAARKLALTNNEGWLLVQDSVMSSDPVGMSPTAELPVVYTDEAALVVRAPEYTEGNIVSVSDDDLEHPREDPSAAPTFYNTTEGDN